MSSDGASAPFPGTHRDCLLPSSWRTTLCSRQGVLYSVALGGNRVRGFSYNLPTQVCYSLGIPWLVPSALRDNRV
jgi:hypothetical protein